MKLLFTISVALLTFSCIAQTGKATYYANKFNGRKTANNEVYKPNKLTAASNTLPFGTLVKVTNLSNLKTVIVIINDRMAKYNKRLIDLSKLAAIKLGFYGRGITIVSIEVIKKL